MFFYMPLHNNRAAGAGDLHECLQYLVDNDVMGPNMTARYFNDRILIPATSPEFPAGPGSSVCINYTQDELDLALRTFSTVATTSVLGDKIVERPHDDVGLSQESYEAPEYDPSDVFEGIYNFSQRALPPDDPDIPQEKDDVSVESRSDESDDDDSSVDGGNMIDYDDEQAADTVMHQNDRQVEDILEQDDLLRFPGFVKRVKERMMEQLALLEQYARSGNCDAGRYNLQKVCDECVKPLTDFRLRVQSDIGQHSRQNQGQRYVSSNCINPTSRRRVLGAKWGISQFSEMED